MTRYGIDVLVMFLFLCLIIGAVVVLLFTSPYVLYPVFIVLGCIVLLAVNFFRDPDRSVPDKAFIAVSPADGKIVRISSAYEPDFLRQEAYQVSIFMSPLDVHVNRIPLSGTISLLRHVSGKFTAAFADKASEVNEHTMIGIECDVGGRVLVKQIAGAVARRIVADLHLGQRVNIGERFGMIKFGSRVDVYFPKNFTVSVRMHEHVRAGASILATYPANT